MTHGFFHSPFAEMCAIRIATLLQIAGINAIAAQPNGRVMGNYQGHIHLFGLDNQSNLLLIDSADLTKPENQKIDVVIQ